MARLASLMIWAFALQCIVPASSETHCMITVDRENCAWPLDYRQQPDLVRKNRTNTFISVSLTMTTDGPSNDCGNLQLENLKVQPSDGSSVKYNSKGGSITERTDDWNGTRHGVNFKINAEVLEHFKSDKYSFVLLRYQPKYSQDNCSSSTYCTTYRVHLRNDDAPVIRIERMEERSDSDHLGNTSVPSSVLRNGTQVAVWKENPLGILAVNVSVLDDNAYSNTKDRFLYSAITCFNVTFSAVVQFFNNFDSHQHETVAEADALSVERPLGTRSASCQQLAWCDEVNLKNSSEDRNRALLQYRWNVTELNSTVQKLYEQLDLSNSNRPFALVFVTMKASASSGTANPLSSSQKVVWALRLPQSFRAAVVGKSTAKSSVKAETLTLMVVVFCVMRAVYEHLNSFNLVEVRK